MRATSLAAAVLVLLCGCALGPDNAPERGKPVVLLETSLGNIKVGLDPVKAPISV